jgi:hypothetical protein
MNENTITTTATKSPQELLHIIKLASAKQEQYILKNLFSDEWQLLLSYLKSINKPSPDDKIKRKPINSHVVGRKWSLSDNNYNETIDAITVRRLNDILKQIRSGEVDYVYYINDVITLLRYEPDMDVTLKDGIFRVWKEK